MHRCTDVLFHCLHCYFLFFSSLGFQHSHKFQRSNKEYDCDRHHNSLVASDHIALHTIRQMHTRTTHSYPQTCFSGPFVSGRQGVCIRCNRSCFHMQSSHHICYELHVCVCIRANKYILTTYMLTPVYVLAPFPCCRCFCTFVSDTNLWPQHTVLLLMTTRFLLYIFN